MRGIEVSTYLFTRHAAKPYHRMHAIAIVSTPVSPASKSSSQRPSNLHCSPVDLVYNVVYHRPKRTSAMVLPSSSFSLPAKFPVKLLLRRSLLLVVVRHLQTRPLKATLDIEALVRLRAVKDSLVAANVLRDKVQRLDDPQTELLALLVLCDSDVFDVADEAEVVDARVVNIKVSDSLNPSCLPKRCSIPGQSKLTISSQPATLLCLRPCPRRPG
jgi:hypothetical protein